MKLKWQYLWEIITDLSISQYNLCQPLLMEFFGVKDIWFNYIISPLKRVKWWFMKEEGAQCKADAWDYTF